MDNQSANVSEIIQIQSIEASDWGVKINASDKRVFNVSRTKQDGTTTVAWQQMLDMGLKGADPITNSPGAKVEIWFKEVPNKHGGTSRYISSFKEAGTRPVGLLFGNGGNTSAPAQKSSPGANSEPTRESNEAFGKRLAIHGFVNGMLASGASIETVKGQLNQLIEFEDAIDKVLNPSKFRQQVMKVAPKVVEPVEPDLPIINQDEDDPTGGELNPMVNDEPDVEGIPF
jgi:hypothetical protein